MIASCTTIAASLDNYIKSVESTLATGSEIFNIMFPEVGNKRCFIEAHVEESREKKIRCLGDSSELQTAEKVANEEFDSIDWEDGPKIGDADSTEIIESNFSYEYAGLATLDYALVTCLY